MFNLVLQEQPHEYVIFQSWKLFPCFFVEEDLPKTKVFLKAKKWNNAMICPNPSYGR